MLKTRSSYPGFTQAIARTDWSRCEEVILQFEQDWQVGKPMALDAYLLSDADARRPLLVELVHIDLEFRVKQGDAARVEEYLAAHAELADDPAAAMDLVSAEYLLRRNNGESVKIDEYLGRFPQWRQPLLARLVQAESLSSTSPAPSVDAWPAIPGYELISQIGRGGMGVVHKARDTNLGRYVALKFLPPEYVQDSDRLNRFLREARTASALNHPYICTVYALGDQGGQPFLVLEFVDGSTLREISTRRPDLDEMVGWLAQVAGALAAAHAAGVVHRDIKPENIMVRPDGYVKVLDFGLARGLPTLSTASSTSQGTKAGVLLGTIAYMSPEQARGEVAESPADIFSLGIVTYELLTGQHPFQASSSFAMLDAIANAPVISPLQWNAAIPIALGGLIESMLQKDPLLRPTAAEALSAFTALLDADRWVTHDTRPARPIVHREAELEFLRAAFTKADRGEGSFVCIAGESGIGKTTLVEDFLTELSSWPTPVYIAAGNCSEQLADTGVYLPVMDALHNLLRHGGSAAARILRTVAPAWYRQLSTAASMASVPTAESESAGSRTAMLREFLNLFQEIGRLGTVVLWLDDVHWADYPTVDLLAHLGRNCSGLRLLVVATYRPAEMLLGLHPFRRVKLELQRRGTCTERRLALLSRDDVAAYIGLAFPHNKFPADFAELIFSRTEGNALFVVDLLRYLGERGTLAIVDGVWSIVGEFPDLPGELPESIRGMIDRLLDQLADEDRKLLGAASVQGQVFDSAILADALKWNRATVEEQLDSLATVQGLVRLESQQDLPDGTLNERYRFVHSLYQHELYSSLSPTRRAGLGLALAKSLERHFAADLAAVATELAYLYECGRDHALAAGFYCRAAQNAARVYAHHEAAGLARRGLELLSALPETEMRAVLEFRLQAVLGQQLQAAEGFTASGAEQAYLRALELAPQVGDVGHLVPQVLWGLFSFAKVRSDLTRATRLAEELIERGRRTGDQAVELQGHQALGVTALSRGRPTLALTSMDMAVRLYDPHAAQAYSFSFGPDQRAVAKSYGWLALWLLGRPDEAERQCHAAIQLSRDLTPTSRLMAFQFAAILAHFRRDPVAAAERIGVAKGIAMEHGMRWWQAWDAVMEGWSLAVRTGTAEGIDLLRIGLAELQSTGSLSYRTYHLGLLAEALAAQGYVEESCRTLDEALELVQRTDERMWEAELHRLRGESWLLLPGNDGHRRDRALEEFETALAIARDQEARALELRAAISLTTRSNSSSAEFAAAKEQLARIYHQFSEGFGTDDLQTSAHLLGLAHPEPAP